MARRGRHESTRAVVLGVLALGLLIWAKLRLVTTIPRSALADPPSGARAGATGDPARDRARRQRAVAEVPGAEPSQD